MDWLERSDWANRSPELGVLGEDVKHVQMEYLPALPDRTWELWRTLPEQTNILAVDRVGFLRYAALDWTHQKLAITDPTTLSRFATWGLVLARAYQHVAKHVNDRAWLARPLVKFDLEGVMRIGFLRAEGEYVAPETLDQWPLCDERALVYVVARTLVTLAVEVPWDVHLGKVLARALDRDPAKRYATLGLLEAQLCSVGAKHLPSKAPSRNAWPHIETGLGWLAMDRREIAIEHFLTAVRYDNSTNARELLGIVSEVAPTPTPTPTQLSPWKDVLERGRACENLHDWTGALALYKLVQCEDDNDVIEHALARARCRLALGDGDRAVAFAREVLARDPARHEARAIEVRALLEAKLFDDAIVAADAWLNSIDDGEAHYARGRALLALGRLVEARDAFDRACVLAPKLVTALWLRSAVDRSLGRLRASVGTPVPMPVDLPVGPVRDALVAGRVDEAIALLWGEPPQQLLGDLLLYATRYDEALRVFESLDGNAALAGKARALIDLGRTDEALAILDVIGNDGFIAIRR